MLCREFHEVGRRLYSVQLLDKVQCGVRIGLSDLHELIIVLTRNLRAVSITPRFSTFLSASSNSGAPIAAMSREPICGKISASSRERSSPQYLGASLLRCLAIHSRATASNVFSLSSLA